MVYFHKTLYAAFTALFALGVCASDTLEEIPLEPDPFTADDDIENETVFITPARMASSFLDSPNAVTSLDVPTLRKLGITEMVDAMRLVPGMMVSETHGSDVSVGYHGANVNVPRRSEVLYNSNRLHRPGYAGAHWYRLPIDLQDLTFIEVVRGPSPEYGTNAMTSTVNLIQDTVATRGLYGSARVGDGATRDVFLNGGWLFGETQLGLRYFHRENDGFDGATGFEGDYKNDVSTDSVMFNVEHRLNDGWMLDVAASYADSTYQVPGFGHLVPDDPFVEVALENFRVAPDADESAGFISGNVHGAVSTGNTLHGVVLGLNFSNFSRDQAISLCGNNFAFDPRVAEVDGLPSVHFHVDDQLAVVTAMLTGNLVLEHSLVQTPTPEEQSTIDALGPYLQGFGLDMLEVRCGITDQDLDEDRYEFNTHVVSHLSESLQNVLGLSVTHNSITSQTYLNGTVEQDSIHVYDTLRYSPADRWVINGTLSLEGADNVDSSDALSYRLSANYQIQRDWVLRVMHARSERLPDVYETSRNWTYFTQYDAGEIDHLGRTAASLTRVAVSPDDLEPEVLRNTEIGISYSVFNRFQADAKLFYEDYSDLISEAFNYVDFQLTNNGELQTQGIEFGLHHTTEGGFEWGASYTYLDADSDTPFERSLRPDHSGSLWAILPLGSQSHLSGVYFGASDVAEGSYDRFDFTLSHRVLLQRGHLDLQVNYRRYPDGINAFTEISSFSPNIAQVDGQDRLFFTAALSFF
jgi:outer membrane receptor for monomeric catechols